MNINRKIKIQRARNLAIETDAENEQLTEKGKHTANQYDQQKCNEC